MPPEQMGAGVDYGSPLAGSAHTQHLKQLRHLNQEYPHIDYPDTQVKHQSLRVSVQLYRKSTKRQCHNFTMRLSLLINYGSRNRKTKQGLQRDPGRISCQFRLIESYRWPKNRNLYNFLCISIGNGLARTKPDISSVRSQGWPKLVLNPTQEA